VPDAMVSNGLVCLTFPNEPRATAT
jgi:hypothetical protein